MARFDLPKIANEKEAVCLYNYWYGLYIF
ncbi:protein of unknown function [Pseudodesulfovibrio profundus]|uniref:Uncharacterized protein n=1 Tax=Pseudodesulfovibrio profundus TaxID=57320 RepID=A0A2C8F5R7_9BACT|nr:protein of unknown function [Pseudodesulfovibrio profundus]